MEKKNINEVIAELSVEQLAGMIDHTFLKPFGDASPIEKLCAEARQYQFAMVAINPAEVETCVKLLEGSGVRVGAAIGFPLGQNTVECKAFETRDAIAKGATEIDTVINVRALQKGQTEIVKKEIEDMVSICKPAGVICKVILETCYLTDEEKDSTMIGMNYAEGSFLRIFLKDRKMEEAALIGKSNGVLYPMDQIPADKMRLPSFVWFDYIRPLNKYDIFEWRGKKAGETLQKSDRKPLTSPRDMHIKRTKK